jgi:pimeloyl-ACP methyl ester carboxylesterase
MGGMVAQLLYRRHPSLLSGLVLCATARNVLGTPAEKLAALALPTAAVAIRWNPFLQPMSAEFLGMALMGPVEDPAAARQAREQLRRTSLGTAISAVQAACEFSSHSWIGEVDVPTAVVVTARDRIVPVSRQLRLARAIPGASVHEVDADHAVCVARPQLFTQALLQACWSVTAARGAHAQPGLTGTAL